MTLSKHLCVLTFYLFVLVTTVSCQTTSPSNSKQKVDSTIKPLRSFQQIIGDSLPKPVGYVNDYENLYTEKEKETLENLIADFEKSTAIQIVLITFDTTMTSTDSLDALTLRIANFWGVGQKDKNNGVTIGISRGNRKMKIQNGYGIEKILTDSETKEIIDTAFIPSFKDGKYFKGTLIGLKTLMATLRKNVEEKPKVEF